MQDKRPHLLVPESTFMREKLLFIAPTVPLFDRTSGDLRLFTILKILSRTYDIFYLAKKNWVTDTFNTSDFYISALKDLGIRVYIEDVPLKNLLITNVFKAAFLEFYYTAEYFLPRIKLLQPSCPVIVDSVDVHYLRMKRKHQITNDMKDLMEAEETQKREIDIYSQADITLTVTEEDARSLESDHRNLTLRILPNIHPLVPPSGDRSKREIIFVGGFGHEPNIDAVVYFCGEILPRIRQSIPDVRFTIVGSNPTPEVSTLGNDYITVTGFVPSTTPYLQRSYISVAPLRYGAGMKGKIGEAMAHGLPVVTTSIGAEGMGLKDGENILIAESPETFSDAVVALMRDDELYDRVKANGIRHIENNFTPERIGERIGSILAELDVLHARKMSLSSRISFFLSYSLERYKNKRNSLSHSK